MVVAALGGYAVVGAGVMAVIAEPVRATIVVSAVAAVAVLGARRVRPGWLTYPRKTRGGGTAASGVPGVRQGVALWVVLGVACAVVAGQSWAVWLYTMQGSVGFDRTVEVRQGAGVLLTLVLALVAAPIAEECLFRGLVYPLLRRRVDVILASTVTAGVFALVHGNLVQIAVAGPLALVLALVYEHTRRLWPCMVIHLGFNVAAALLPPPVFTAWATPVGLVWWTAAFLVTGAMLYRAVCSAPVAPMAEP